MPIRNYELCADSFGMMSRHSAHDRIDWFAGVETVRGWIVTETQRFQHVVQRLGRTKVVALVVYGLFVVMASVLVTATLGFGSAQAAPTVLESPLAPAEPAPPLVDSALPPAVPVQPTPSTTTPQPVESVPAAGPVPEPLPARKPAPQPKAAPEPRPESGAGARAVAFAMAQLGVPYRWGGTSRSGFDCSGLMLRAWQSAGVQLPRTARQQARAGKKISRAELRAGDLVISNGYGHISMYIGNGRVVEAPTPGKNVSTTAIPKRVTAYVRVG